MPLQFDHALAQRFASTPQRIRVMSEDWTARNLFCLNCTAASLVRLPHNTHARDFRCDRCDEAYELKAGAGPPPPTLNDGALSAMLRRLAADQAPNLIVLRYARIHYTVTDLFIIPRHFLIEDVIESRKPLAPTARRAGWIGCKFRLDKIPTSGRVSVIQAGQLRTAEACREDWRRTLFVRRAGAGRRWLLAVMQRIEQLPTEFSLQDAYAFVPELEGLFPANSHVPEKLRQQLQILRDTGHLQFLARGRYRRLVT